jgi:Uma2 family endonuclease
MSAQPVPHRFSVEEYERFGEAGIFNEKSRVELLDGEIIDMAPIGKFHAMIVRELIGQMSRHFGDVGIVDSQNPIVLDDFSEPQPDILLLRPELRKAARLPNPADVILLIEVAETTYLYDSVQKLRAYARSGVAEYWIVNIGDSCVEVYREPQGEAYTQQFRRVAGETLAPAAFPDRAIAVADILP